jgi:hypothetical protein
MPDTKKEEIKEKRKRNKCLMGLNKEKFTLLNSMNLI